MSDGVGLLDHVTALDMPETISREWLLQAFLEPLGIDRDSVVAEVCEDVFLAEVGDTGGSLQMRPGGWRVDIGASAAKGVLVTALLAAGLAAVGKDEIPAELIPAALPLVVDVQRVRLDRRDRALLVPLRIASAGLEGMNVNPQLLYDRLDATVRDQLNQGDFLAFCGHLIEAGHMDDGGHGDIRARPADRPAWIRVTLT